MEGLLWKRVALSWAPSETLGRGGAGVLQKWGLCGGGDLDPDSGVDPSGAAAATDRGSTTRRSTSNLGWDSPTEALPSLHVPVSRGDEGRRTFRKGLRCWCWPAGRNGRRGDSITHLPVLVTSGQRMDLISSSGGTCGAPFPLGPPMFFSSCRFQDCNLNGRGQVALWGFGVMQGWGNGRVIVCCAPPTPHPQAPLR